MENLLGVFIVVFCFVGAAVSLPVSVIQRPRDAEPDPNTNRVSLSTKDEYATEGRWPPFDIPRFLERILFARKLTSSLDENRGVSKRSNRVKRHHPSQPLENPAGPQSTYALVPVQSQNGGSSYLLLKNLKIVVDNKSSKVPGQTLSPMIALPYPGIRSTPSVPQPQQEAGSPGAPQTANTKAPGSGAPWMISRIVDKGSIRIERVSTPAPVKSTTQAENADPGLDIPVNRSPEVQPDTRSQPSNDKTPAPSSGSNIEQKVSFSQAVNPSSSTQSKRGRKRPVSIPKSSNPFTRGRPDQRLRLKVPYRGATGLVPKQRPTMTSRGTISSRTTAKTMKPARFTPAPNTAVTNSAGTKKTTPRVSNAIVGDMTPKANSLVGSMTPNPGEKTTQAVGLNGVTQSPASQPTGAISKAQTRFVQTASAITKSLNNRAGAITKQKTLSIRVKTVKTVVETGPAISGSSPAIASSTVKPATPAATTTQPTTTTTTPPTTATQAPEKAIVPTTEEPEDPPTTMEEIEIEDLLSTAMTSTTTAYEVPPPSDPASKPVAPPGGKPGTTTSVPDPAGRVAGWAQTTTEPALGPNDRINTTDVPEEIEPNERHLFKMANTKPPPVSMTTQPPVKVTTTAAAKTTTSSRIKESPASSKTVSPSTTTEEPEEREVTVLVRRRPFYRHLWRILDGELDWPF